MTQPPGDVFTRRICLHMDGMDAVSVRRDVPYDSHDKRLNMDVYYPPETSTNTTWPCVVIVAGYPGTPELGPAAPTYKEFGWTVSMAQLVACSGIVAIAYTNREPVDALERLLGHLHEEARALKIDASRTGVVAVSGNVPTALTTLLCDSSRPPACAAFSYGCFLDLEGAANEVAELARQAGFANPMAGRTVADLRRDIPMFVARAGRDQFSAMNVSIDRFVSHALKENLPITLVNYAEGPHAYDLFDDSRQSQAIVRQTLGFLTHHLNRDR